MRKTNKKIGELIALIAFLILGEAYSGGLAANGINEKESIKYTFESIYPDIETMNIIEHKLKESNAKNSENTLV